MKTAHKPRAPRVPRSEKGFSLIEMMVAMMITMIVMASVFTLLQKGQTTFQREPEVAEMNQNARYGLDMIVRDLTDAGLGANLPVLFAVVPLDGGGNPPDPDEVTIMYADPTSRRSFRELPSAHSAAPPRPRSIRRPSIPRAFPRAIPNQPMPTAIYSSPSKRTTATATVSLPSYPSSSRRTRSARADRPVPP